MLDVGQIHIALAIVLRLPILLRVSDERGSRLVSVIDVPLGSLSICQFGDIGGSRYHVWVYLRAWERTRCVIGIGFAAFLVL